ASQAYPDAQVHASRHSAANCGQGLGCVPRDRDNYNAYKQIAQPELLRCSFNNTRAMAALCQSLLRLREASRAALIVVHHVRKSIGRYEIGSAFRGSSALHAVGDSYLLVTRPAPQLPTVELRFQFRYAAPQPPRLLQLDPQSLWFSAAGESSATPAAARRKVEQADVTQALTGIGEQVRYTQLRDQIMDQMECSKRTAQLAITEACRQGSIVQTDGQYRLPL